LAAGVQGQLGERADDSCLAASSYGGSPPDSTAGRPQPGPAPCPLLLS